MKRGDGPYREATVTPTKPPQPPRRWWRLRVATFLPLVASVCVWHVLQPDADEAVMIGMVCAMATSFIGTIACHIGAWDAVWAWLIDRERAECERGDL
jgi:hypothetical protein